MLDSFNSSIQNQPLLLAEAPDGLLVAYATCNVTFHSEMLGMLYVVFLVLVVVFLAFKVKKQQNFRMIHAIQSSVSPFCIMTSMFRIQARGVRENYREAMYIGLAMGFAVCIMTVWVLAGLMTEKRLANWYNCATKYS